MEKHPGAIRWRPDSLEQRHGMDAVSAKDRYAVYQTEQVRKTPGLFLLRPLRQPFYRSWGLAFGLIRPEIRLTTCPGWRDKSSAENVNRWSKATATACPGYGAGRLRNRTAAC